MTRIGKLGAAASPVSNYRTGGLPMHEIQKIYNDRSLSLEEAYEKYYNAADPKHRVSPNTILRWAREERFKYDRRPAGGISRKPKQ